MKVKQKEASLKIYWRIVGVLTRHGVDVETSKKYANSITHGASAYVSFGSENVFGSGCNVKVGLDKLEFGEELGKFTGPLDPRVGIGWPSNTRSIASAITCVENYKKAIAFAAEIETMLSEIEIVKE